MSESHIWERWFSRKNHRFAAIVKEVSTSEEIRIRISKERARADRTGHTFSVATFNFKKTLESNGLSKKLTQFVLERKRFEDEVGVLTAHCLGILLPDTPPEGAWRFVDDILGRVSAADAMPEAEVFVYPSSKEHADGDSTEVKNLSGNGAVRSNGSSGDLSDIALSSRDQRATRSLSQIMAERLPPWKRGLDILLACLGLVLFSPLFVVIAVMIKLSSTGPVFFSQERVGYLGRPFRFWKFRTMEHNADFTVHSRHLEQLITSDQPLVKLDTADDCRIISAGNLLRRTYLDELPQLLNVIRGDMSLVGPRPCLYYEVENYKQWQRRRFDSVPGMTGLWQVNGKNTTTFIEMIRLDITYRLRRSLFLDLRILVQTIPFIIKEARFLIR